MAPLTAELTIQPGAALGPTAAHGFAETTIILRTANRAPGSGTADLRWADERVDSGLTVAALLAELWRGETVAHLDALAFGRLLFRRLLAHPHVSDRWHKIQELRRGRPLRLELILPPAADSLLHAVPFELLADDRGFLFYGRATIVRCVRDLEARRATIRPRDRVVVVWANPEDLPERIEDRVFEAHETSLAKASQQAELELAATIARADLARVQDSLQAARPVPVVSLIAHGYTSGGRVVLEQSDRSSHAVPASSLAAALRDASTQVALLWSCHGARRHAELGSLAECLLDPEGGDLAAVLAAHGAVRADWTARAASRLLGSLTGSADHDFERAVTLARQTLPEDDLQWAALAYYARPTEGRSVTYEQAAAVTIEALARPREAAPEQRFETRSAELPPRTLVDAPRQPFYWIERPGDVGDVRGRLAAARVVTVHGMPGIGKTEIAREVAEQISADDHAGITAAVWLALDELRTVDDLRDRLAGAAGVREPVVSVARIARAIGNGRVLWVLDNAEDLIRLEGVDLRELLSALVERCPGLRLLITSQRPLGDLRTEREDTYMLRRIADPVACRRLFARASGSPLGNRIDDAVVTELLELLDGHPRSLVLVASQVRDGGANLPSIVERLRLTGDEAVLAAELLDSDVDWTAHDTLRTERLISSLHLAYQPLRDHHPAAAELFAWLGTLPGGLAVPVATAICGDDTPERIAALGRHSLVELRGEDERLELPTPVRWYAAHRLAEMPAERQRALLLQTLTALGSLMSAARALLGKPGAQTAISISQREALNLEALVGWDSSATTESPGMAEALGDLFVAWSEICLAAGYHAHHAALLERVLQQIGSRQPLVQADLQLALGRLYLRGDRYADAEQAYLAALALYQAQGSRLGEANTWLALGQVHMRRERTTEAEHALGQAIERYRELRDVRGEARAHGAMGDLYRYHHRLEAAIAPYDVALSRYRSIDDQIGVAQTLVSLGEFWVRIGDVHRAEQNYDAARETFVQLEDRFGEAATLLALGTVYLYTGRINEAEQVAKDALAIYTELHSSLGAANASKSLGDLYVRTNRLPAAEALYQRALRAYREIDDRNGEANTLLSLGTLCYQVQRIPDAEHAINAALAIFTALDDAHGRARSLLASGALHELTGRIEDAEMAYRSSMQLASSISDTIGVAQAVANLGSLDSARAQPTNAYVYFRAARTGFFALGNAFDAATQIGHMARAAHAAGHLDRAIVLAATAWKQLRDLDVRNAMVASLDTQRFALEAGAPELARCAQILSWYHARTLGDPRAQTMWFDLKHLLPPDAWDTGLDAETLADLEHQIDTALAQVQQRLGDEDPLGPLPAPAPGPAPAEDA